jgi:chromosomal replication initiator protein
MTAIDARFVALNRKLDALIHMLTAPGEGQPVARHLLAADIRRVVAMHFGVTEHEIDRPGRSARLVRIRQIACYLCRAHTSRSLPEIGRLFGRRHHGTILHGIRRITALRPIDPSLDRDLSDLETRLAELLARRRAHK